MSGVGKTEFIKKLDINKWVCYSIDYVIARALEGEIRSFVLSQMDNFHLQSLISQKALDVDIQMGVYNLYAIAMFLGKLGSVTQGGLDLMEFVRRQRLYRDAEIEAIKNLPKFAQSVAKYGYENILLDCTGSICEVIDVNNPKDEVWQILQNMTEILYIQADLTHIRFLLKRLEKTPKPILFREEFLYKYLNDNNITDTETLNPDSFLRNIYESLFIERNLRYETLAKNGATISIADLTNLKSEEGLFKIFLSGGSHKSQCHAPLKTP
jgi:hypothetical protein